MKKFDSKPIIDDLYNFVDLFTDEYMNIKGEKPELCILMAGDDPGSMSYVSMKEKAAIKHGINTVVKRYNTDEYTNKSYILDSLKNDIKYCASNKIPCMVQLPIPLINKNDQQELLNNLDLFIDVDGLNNNTFNIDFDLSVDSKVYKVYTKRIKPCTSAGIRMLLKYNNIDLENKNVLIVGRSELLGRPLSTILLDDNANISIAHSKTSIENLKAMALRSDIIISTTGQANLITPDMVNQNAILIDTGFSRIDGNIVGDIDKECWGKAYMYNEYTKCIGPLTIAILLFNTCLYSYIISELNIYKIDLALAKLIEKYDL